jgi:hypothetical protein
MKHLKKFNEAFDILMTNNERSNFESDFGFTIEDLEDVLLELSDLASIRGGCKIKTPSQKTKVRYIEDNRIVIKNIAELIILANIKVTQSEYESIISTIKQRLSSMNLHIEDITLEHERTNLDLGIYFICLRLITNTNYKLLNTKSIRVWKD